MADPKGVIIRLDRIAQWEMLSDEQAGALIKALLRYAETGARIETQDGMVAMAFSFMADTIDSDTERYQRICERNARNGAKGGRPKKQEDSSETQKTQSVFEEPKKGNTNTNTNTNTNIIITNNDIPAKRKRFTPPSLEEIKAYCAERNSTVNPESFFDFYESKGWLVGRNPMKDWRAAVRTWERRDSEGKKQTVQKQGGFAGESFTASDLESLVNLFGEE